MKNIFHDNRTVTEEYYPPSLIGTPVLENLPATINAYRLAMTPVPEQIIIEELTKLKIKTASRQTDTIDFKFMIRVWVDDLKHFPADILMHALKPKTKWFPDFHDVVEVCEKMTKRRRDILEILEATLTLGQQTLLIERHKEDPIIIQQKLIEERNRVLLKFEELKKGLDQADNQDFIAQRPTQNPQDQFLRSYVAKKKTEASLTF